MLLERSQGELSRCSDLLVFICLSLLFAHPLDMRKLMADCNFWIAHNFIVSEEPLQGISYLRVLGEVEAMLHETALPSGSM
jgi:hypothetical protein